jgi:hypothetical protein
VSARAAVRIRPELRVSKHRYRTKELVCLISKELYLAVWRAVSFLVLRALCLEVMLLEAGGSLW